jgi:hypothetical protein
VFICGRHRTGISILGRNITSMEKCTGFKDIAVIEDEGQFLQAVYPTSKAYGGAGCFAFDPPAHLTGISPLLTQQNFLSCWLLNRSPLNHPFADFWL